MKKLSYLGPSTTYSGLAAKTITPKIKDEVELIALPSFRAIATSIKNEETEYALLPYYNYLEGLVQESLDLIFENDLQITGFQRLPIELSIGGYDASESNVYSHPKALAQSSNWLWQNYPNSRLIPTSSTGAAADKISSEGVGLAISHIDALENNGLEVIARDIGNRKNGVQNFTDFYLLNNEDRVEYNPKLNYSSMVAIVPIQDREGLLANVLTQVARYKINNAKIHSRPAPDGIIANGVEPQMFYLEMMKHSESEEMKNCLDSLRCLLETRGCDSETVRVMGTYAR